MCGEIDENISINADLLQQFSYLAHKQIGANGTPPAPQPTGLDQAAGRAAYMKQLFNHLLADMAKQVEQAEDTEVVDAVASQAIALARLAGFIAGQLPPAADLYRATIDAVGAGHDDCRRMLQAHHRDHHHDHDHDHGHHHHHH
jgi:hypothetical protein